MIYLDNAATTLVTDSVINALTYSLTVCNGNPSSIHQYGRAAKELLDSSRKAVAKLFDGNPGNIIFTPGGSAANTLLFRSLIPTLQASGRDKVLVSAIEHESVINAAESLRQFGIEPLYIPVNKSGFVDLDWIEDHIKEAALVSVMAVNNEVGSIQSIKEIGELCKANGALFHSDCVQAISVVDLSDPELHLDFATISGHKFHAPKGVGALYAKDKSLLSNSMPLVHGGGQEFGFVCGTENVSNIYAMSVAAKDIRNPTPDCKTAAIEELSKLAAEKELEYEIIGGTNNEYSPNILCVRFPGVDAQTLVVGASSVEIYVSAGSACSSNSNVPSHVLTAMGYSEDEARECVRFSFCQDTPVWQAVDGIKLVAKYALQIKDIKDKL